MAIQLPPPTGDAKNPPTTVDIWARLFSWIYLLWTWVTVDLPRMLTFGGSAGTYSSAILSTAGQSDTGGLGLIGPAIALFAGPTQTAQSIANATNVTLTNWTSVPLDTANAFNATTGVYTIPLEGIYIVSGTLSFASNIWNATALSSVIAVNGSVVADCFIRYSNATVTNNGQPPTVVWTGRLKRGDTVVFQGFQNSGAAVNTEGSHTNFSINRVGS